MTLAIAPRLVDSTWTLICRVSCSQKSALLTDCAKKLDSSWSWERKWVYWLIQGLKPWKFTAPQDAIVLRGSDILTVPELLPGWEMEVSSIWTPVFVEE